MRNTASLRAVLKAFLEEPLEARYGYELVKLTGFKSGTVKAILDRLAEAGIVSQEWEDVDTVQAGRPVRRYSRLTESGTEFARQILNEWVSQGGKGFMTWETLRGGLVAGLAVSARCDEPECACESDNGRGCLHREGPWLLSKNGTAWCPSHAVARRPNRRLEGV